MKILLLVLVFFLFTEASTVLDRKTKLMWQDNKEVISVKKNFKSAQEYCKQLELVGYKDWLLPSQSQLLTIADKNRYYPSIKREFKNVSPTHYWSSSANKDFSAFAWYVYFKDGHSYTSIKNKSYNVRCVRKQKEKRSDFNTLVIKLVESELKDFPQFKKPSEIVKGEFEKTKDYNKRVDKARKDHNIRLATYKAKYVRKKQIAKDKAIKKALEINWGRPIFENPRYDADNEQFIAKMYFEGKPTFSEQVAIPVGIRGAKRFKKYFHTLKPKAIFNYNGQNVTLKSIYIPYNHKKYKIAFTDININDTFASVKIESNLNLDKNIYSSISMGKSKIAKSSSSKMRNLHELDNAIKRVSQVKLDKNKWLFVIGIEKYIYTDNISYATRSAKMFTKIMKKRQGVPTINTYMLLNEQATQAEIKTKMRKMLRRVKKGDTIYFYYNGHGIPIPQLNNEPYMLASNSEPDYIADEKYFSLKNIYTKLSSSKASKVIAVIDSCFSGVTDGKSILKGVAATKMVAKPIVFDREKMVVMTAGKADQYSNGYNKKGHRLFSYFIMKNMLNGDSEIKNLYKHTKQDTYNTSIEEYGDSRTQEPAIVGNARMKL